MRLLPNGHGGFFLLPGNWSSDGDPSPGGPFWGVLLVLLLAVVAGLLYVMFSLAK